MAHPTLLELEAAANNRRLHEVIARLDPAHHIQGPLRAALRTDLAFLVAHPDALFSCLYSRLSWLGVDWRAGQRGPRHPAGAMVEGWRATRTKPWVRSLRPMCQPVEEYRCAQGGNALTVTRDHVFLDVGEGPAASRRWRRTSWNRNMGMRSEHEHVPTAPAVEVRTQGWGNASVHDASGAMLWRVPVPDTLSVYGHAVREDTLALCGIDEDADGFLMVFDLRRRRLRWRAERGEGLYSVALGRDHVAASGGRTTVVWGINGGDPLWLAPAGLPAFDPEDGLVTHAGGVVRLWGPVTAPKPGWIAGMTGARTVLPAPEVPAAGLASATFSSEGWRLVSASLLVDGVSGAFIAEIPYESPRYLEGGPPRNAIHIGDTTAVSLERGVQMWSLEDGSSIVARNEPWYTSMDRVAIAPDGEHYAVTRVDGGPVTVVETRTGGSFELTLPGGALDWGRAGLVVGGADGVARLWHRTNPRRFEHGFPITNLRVVGDTLYTAGTELAVWNIGTGECTRRRVLGEGDQAFTKGDRVEYHWRRDDVERPTREVEARDRGGLVVFERAGKEIAHFPAAGPLVQHPTEPVFAGPGVHVRLEG